MLTLCIMYYYYYYYYYQWAWKKCTTVIIITCKPISTSRSRLFTYKRLVSFSGFDVSCPSLVHGLCDLRSSGLWYCYGIIHTRRTYLYGQYQTTFCHFRAVPTLLIYLLDVRTSARFWAVVTRNEYLEVESIAVDRNGGVMMAQLWRPAGGRASTGPGMTRAVQSAAAVPRYGDSLEGKHSSG